jgi:hypothetical protein
MDKQQLLEEGRRTAHDLSEEASSISRQLVHAQVAAARAAFNISNLWSLGRLSPIADRFEEGLDLYERTVGQVQDTTKHLADANASQIAEIAKTTDRWAKNGQAAASQAAQRTEQHS